MRLSTLCNTCDETLNSLLAEQSWKSHHQTLEGFREAISQRCFICSTSWKSFSEQHRAAWTDGSTPCQPMTCRIYREESEKTLVKLQILYLDPISNQSTDIRFRLLPTDDDEFKDSFSFSQLEAKTSSPLTLGLIYEWYLHCRANHTHCRRLAEAWCPTRLLDIGAKGEHEWKLHISQENESPRPSYMTRSYRWGSNPSSMLLASNIEKFRRGQPIQDLPQTFKDSIVVARRFSIRYLWIDVHCIVQDSRDDWERESAKMGHVYANSAGNIAASASTDPEGGLFRSRDPETIRPGLVRAAFSTSEPKNYYIFDKSYMERQIFDGPLHRRGWVFQERLLAPRVLHFADEQIFWECFTAHKCEGFPRGIPLYSPLKNLDQLLESSQSSGKQQNLGIFNLWNDLVKAYTKCALTRQRDKLIAFSGLARLFHDNNGDEYIAGLWRSRLAEHLDWRVYKPAAKITSEYRAPSWSWASLDGPVSPSGLSARTNMQISILDVQVQRSGPDSMGQVLGGHIKLNGIVAQVTCHATKDTERRELEIGTHRISVQMFPDALRIRSDESKEICCLVLKTEPVYSGPGEGHGKPHVVFSVVFLALESLHSLSDTYRRVGHFVLYEQEKYQKFGLHVSEDGSIAVSKGSQYSVITII